MPYKPMPYKNVDWNTVSRLQGATHIHVQSQAMLERVYKAGLRCFTVSNYYPSAPYYPLASVRDNQFCKKQAHGVMRNGQYIPGPIDWNAVILDHKSGWANELKVEYRRRLPFALGDPLFSEIPKNIVEAPNAEHHNFTDSRAHINSPGSLFASGTFDVRRHFLLEQKGFARGTGMPWRDAFKRMLDGLLIADGGGITINHPIWSKLPASQIHEMLDFDPRVLGMEIHNDSCVQDRPEEDASQNEKLWDAVLATGRQCFGFFTPDWEHTSNENWQGRCVLLVKEPTTEACLRAYRRGEFYGALRDGGLAFRRIDADQQSVRVELDTDGKIEFITEKGIVQTSTGKSAHYQLPQENGKPNVTFVRIKARDNAGQVLFSQPMLFRPTSPQNPLPAN